jgi:hypothetical protein
MLNGLEISAAVGMPVAILIALLLSARSRPRLAWCWAISPVVIGTVVIILGVVMGSPIFLIGLMLALVLGPSWLALTIAAYFLACRLRSVAGGLDHRSKG